MRTGLYTNEAMDALNWFIKSSGLSEDRISFSSNTLLGGWCRRSEIGECYLELFCYESLLDNFIIEPMKKAAHKVLADSAADEKSKDIAAIILDKAPEEVLQKYAGYPWNPLKAAKIAVMTADWEKNMKDGHTYNFFYAKQRNELIKAMGED